MLDKTVEDIFQAIDILVSNIYIWAFHRLGKERSKPKKSKLALYNRRKLSATHKPFIDLDGGNLFFNENLEPINNKIAFKSRKYLHGSLIDKAYTRNGIFHIVPPSIGNGKTFKVTNVSMILDLLQSLILMMRTSRITQQMFLQSTY